MLILRFCFIADLKDGVNDAATDPASPRSFYSFEDPPSRDELNLEFVPTRKYSEEELAEAASCVSHDAREGPHQQVRHR